MRVTKILTVVVVLLALAAGCGSGTSSSKASSTTTPGTGGKAADVPGVGWAQLATFSHPSDVALGVLLPGLLALTAYYFRASTARDVTDPVTAGCWPMSSAARSG